LGFSNVANFIFTLQISQQNFFGWGTSVSASAQLSSLQSTVQLSYFDPYFLDSNFIFALNLYRIQANRFDFDRYSTGGDVTIGYHLIEDLMAQLTYTNENVDVRASSLVDTLAIENLFRDGTTSSLRLSLTYDKRDNRLFPTKGLMLYGSAELAPPWLGSTFEFVRYSAFSRFYQPLFWGIVFKTNATIGFIQQLDPQKPVPFSERYKLGGINTIRGYYPFTISPTTYVNKRYSPDAARQEFGIGGDKQLIFNLELEFPILEKVGIRGVLFYDMGNAYDVDEKFFQSRNKNLPLGMFHAAGFGFRWFSPLGPLRFEWGIPLQKREAYDQAVQFEFTIGNFF
jgi:outer membrane protein insertion porin family